MRGKSRGQVLLLSVVLLSVVLGLVGAFTGYLGGVRKATNAFSARAAARQAAQSGIEKAVWCLNQSDGASCGGTYGVSYAGESDVGVGGNAYYTTTMTDVSGNLKTVMVYDGNAVRVLVTHKADWDNSGTISVTDIFAYLSSWFANAAGTDINGNGTTDVTDIFAFLAMWFGA